VSGDDERSALGAVPPEAERQLRLAAKRALRGRMRSLRRVLPAPAAAVRSAAACARLVELEVFAGARTVIAYVAFRNELDPAPALERARAVGKRVGLVRVEPGGALSVREHAADAALEENAQGVLEPADTASVIADSDVDLILVPALAADERGHRIGYGGGYYDRLLPRLPAARKVALVYDFQLLCEAPDTEGDVRVDWVVTDKRVLPSA
jgi:5-formyltetrahydrofolate cyclo-ligase